ncbi:hypothetical protein RvY_03602 [Ramazzottius varieornatus]|uniref:Uncharacterized protein n=1 Tax=Ramazzottius varieornatus TaxID=947166 RepID=A0A1D1US09_RAMVA|nr:hypothetical protein RvY_03602 [Ramazzottius varieornatus]
MKQQCGQNHRCRADDNSSSCGPVDRKEVKINPLLPPVVHQRALMSVDNLVTVCPQPFYNPYIGGFSFFGNWFGHQHHNHLMGQGFQDMNTEGWTERALHRQKRAVATTPVSNANKKFFVGGFTYSGKAGFGLAVFQQPPICLTKFRRSSGPAVGAICHPLRSYNDSCSALLGSVRAVQSQAADALSGDSTTGNHPYCSTDHHDDGRARSDKYSSSTRLSQNHSSCGGTTAAAIHRIFE